MKLLNGAEIRDYIKERQAKQVRRIKQQYHIIPKLVILQTIDNPVIDLYTKLKMNYGEDIGVMVDRQIVTMNNLAIAIERANNDSSVQGILLQLPLANTDITDQMIALIDVNKDVDGLKQDSHFTASTVLAIQWLLAGYDIELRARRLAIVGAGHLVGYPLATLWKKMGYDVTVYKKGDSLDTLVNKDIIVSATGVPGLIKSKYIKSGGVVVDAGTADADGQVVGDVADDVRLRQDIIITPVKGGVGPLTIAALMDNLLNKIERDAINNMRDSVQ